MIHVYADDSISQGGGGRLFMAAHIQSAEVWSSFANEWDDCQNEHPRIDYLKMTEATRRQGQFRGWSIKACERKLLALAKIIRRHAPKAFFTSVDVKDFKELVKPYAPYPMDSPYSFAYTGLILGIPRIIPSEMRGKIRLVFDQQDGMRVRIDPVFDSLFTQAPEEWREMYVGPPQFEDDKDILPLQAADMLVWLLRREIEFGQEAKYEGLRDLVLPEGEVHYTEIGKQQLQLFSDEFRNLPRLQEIDKKEWRNLADLYARSWHEFRG